MKICWLLILLALSLSFVLTAGRSREIALQKLPSAVVLDAAVPPGKDQNTCQGFWYQHGFVCNLKKLKKFNKVDMRRLDDIKVDFLSLVNRYQALHRSVLLIKSKLPKNMVRILTTDIGLVSSETDKCWSHMGKLRTNSLCTICSAKNHKYFFQRKAGMSMVTCREILEHCNVHIGQVVDLTELAIFLATTVGRYARWHYGIQTSKNFLVQFYTELSRTIERVQHTIGTMLWVKLFRLYENLKHRKAREKIRLIRKASLSHVSARLCESLVSLTRTPHLKKINKHLEAILKNLEHELKLIVAFKKKKAAAKASKNSCRALTQTTSNWRCLKQKSFMPLFSSDDGGSGVMVVERDDGSSNIAADKQHPHMYIKPVNFSMAFP